nr:hypothetical protein [Tanacetum cinerariifolium]
MRIDELHKFSDGTLNDVRNALDDRLKGIRMNYLPQTIWRKAWNRLLEDDCMRETFGCCKGPYDSSYAAPIFTELHKNTTPRSIVIQRRVKDLQLGVESYQKRLNLTKPDTYRCDLKRREAYTAYSNPRGFIYQNKDKKDGTLNDVRNALDDRLKGIRM